jgi:sugar lactone lactonase YvrE
MKLKYPLMALTLLSAGFSVPALASDPILYVSDSGSSSGIYEFDGLNGNYLGPLTTTPPANSVFYSVGLGSNGNLWATSKTVNSSPATSELINGTNGQVIHPASGGPALSNSEGVVVNNGVVYISDYNTDNITAYSATSGAYQNTFASSATGLSGPEGMVFAGGNMYVANYTTGNIIELNGTNGHYVSTLATVGGANGMTLGADGDLYVASYSSDTVDRITLSGSNLGNFISNSPLNAAGDVKFGPNGNLFVVSTGTSQILEYNGTTGQYMGVFASSALIDPDSIVFASAPPVPELPMPLMLTLGLLVPGLARRARRPLLLLSSSATRSLSGEA